VADDREQVLAVHRPVAEALALQVAVRVKASPADLHDRAPPALFGERLGTDLPGHRRGVVKGIVEAGRLDVQAGIGGAGIRGAE
jgi:hypothetical protein